MIEDIQDSHSHILEIIKNNNYISLHFNTIVSKNKYYLQLNNKKGIDLSIITKNIVLKKHI